MTQAEIVSLRLDTIAKQIGWWLEWDEKHRRMENLTTEDGTSIMALPVPYWPSHGQLKAWIEALNDARQIIGDRS